MIEVYCRPMGLARAKVEGVLAAPSRRINFLESELATKLAEATPVADGRELRALKGRPRAITTRLGDSAETDVDVGRLTLRGHSVLTLAGGNAPATLRREMPCRPLNVACQRNRRGTFLEAEQRWTFGDMATSVQAARMGFGFARYPEEKIREEVAAGELKVLPVQGGGRHVW